jgi:cysteinyl-tRNA synthetase
MNYIKAIDGIGQEDLFYGYNADDKATPTADNEWLSSFLDIAKNNGIVKIMITDYCSTHSKMDNSYSENNSKGYISFAANHRELDNIPTHPTQIYNENSDVITNLQAAKNFLYLISPDNEYPSKQAFVDVVKTTNYDFIIMDFFYNEEEFTEAQIEELKQKANGGTRLLICYMSIGEAEDYRYYWQSNWTVGNPSFIEKENSNWEGNYVVRYWEQEWQNIIFGYDDSYLKNILNAGFDGVYLDIIDAFEQFE